MATTLTKAVSKYKAKGSESTSTATRTGTTLSQLASKYRPVRVTPTQATQEDTDYNKGGFLGGVGYTLGKFGTGAFSVLEGIWDFTAGGIADFFGADEWAEEQFANNIAAGWNQDLDEWYNPSKGMQVVGDVASGISNTLVGIGGAAALTFFSGGALAPYAGTIAAGIMGLGAAGNATSEAYAKTGELGFKEYAYGALSGGTEMALEKFTGVTGKYATKLLGKETAKTVAKKSLLKGMWSDFKSEFVEEAISEFITPYYQRWTQVDPNAENATIQQIGYAGLVGGLSGALMGGIGTGISSAKALNRGNEISKNQDYTNAVVGMAEKFAQYETDNNTGKEAYQYISQLVADFKARDNGTGTLTAMQKKLLGEMEHASVVLTYEPEIQRSKEKIIANADDFAQYINSRNIIDGATGKPFRFANGAELTQNDALVTQFAVADALGQLMLAPDSVYDLVSSKRTDGIMQADFRNFQKGGRAEHKQAVNELFGIDVDGMTYEDFIETIKKTDKAKFDSIQGGMSARAASKKAISYAKNKGAEINAFDKGANIVEGTTVYTSKKGVGGKIIAITKTGNGYYLYNGEDISKKLTKAQLLEVIDALNGVAPATNQATETTAKKGQKTKKKPAVQTSPTGTQTAQETEKSKPKTAPKKKATVKKKTAAVKPATEKAKPTDKATQKREAIAKMRKSEDTTERVLAELYDNGAADYDAVSAMKDGQDLSTVDKVAFFATGTVKDYARQGLYTEKSLAKAIKEFADDIRAGKDVLVQVMDRAIELDGKQQPNWYKEQYHKAAESTTAKKKTATKKTAPKAKETETTTAKPVKEKTIHGKTYKDFTVEEFNALSEPFRNYYLAKSKNPNAIVFVQLGDFYEAFFDDAKTAANEVELTLTGRAVNGYADRVEMVGFPIRFFDNYKAKLNAKGLDVVKVDLDGKKVLYAAKTDSASTETQVQTKKPKKANTANTTAKKKMDDFGEKIGGARKDEWQARGLTAADLDGMNLREIQKYAKKERVWKRPNWVQAVEDGGDRGLLYAQNEIYISLNTQPASAYSYKSKTEEQIKAVAKTYADEVNAIKKMAESVKTADDLKKMGREWLAENGYVEIKNGQLTWTHKYYESPALYGSKYLNTLDNLIKRFDMLGERAYMEGFGIAPENKLPRGYEIRRTRDSMFGSVSETGEYYIVKGHYRVATGFKTVEDALAYGREKFGNATTTEKSGKQRYVPVQLAEVHRDGLDYRKGKKAVGDDFLRDFGIKGGEFGNWLSELDRQTSLDYGYDAFCDLADALGIELTDIGLNGTLSIGFGSRGKGLSGAAAHYEPARKVINLTKMNGAGSLAHEFWHAVEDYISGDTHQSEMTSNFSKMPERTRKAAYDLVHKMQYREGTIEENQLESQKRAERNLRRINAYFDNNFNLLNGKMDESTIQRYVDEKYYKRKPTEADYKRFAELKAQAIKGDTTAVAKFIDGERSIVDEISDLQKDITGRGLQKEDRNALAYLIQEAGLHPDVKVTKKTKFYTDAIAISVTYAKDGGYWDSNCEMLARAFAAYITDKTNRSNDYLSGHSERTVLVEGGTASIMPVGEERKMINAAFDELFAAAKADGLFHESTREKPTTKTRYAISESAELNNQPAGNKSQNLSPLQMKRAESFARTHVKGYENLTAAEKLEVEWTIASGWRYGASESDILSLAKISAQSGVGIGFADVKTATSDGKTVEIDGVCCYRRSGHLTIYLNPNSNRSVEAVTLHELTHTLEGTEGYADLKKKAEEYYAKHPEEKAAIDKMYRDLYRAEQVQFADEILPTELTAHYIEKMLEKRNVLAQMTAEQPTFMQRCINWLKTRVDKLRGIDTQAADEVDMLARKFVSTFNLNKNKSNQKEQGKKYWVSNGKSIITSDMTEQERYEVLKDKEIALTAKADNAKLAGVLAKLENDGDNVSYEKLKIGDKIRLFKKIGEEFGVYKEYSNKTIALSFEYSRGSIDESLHKQKHRFDRFAKMLTCFDAVIENAIGIEAHNRNKQGYKPDTTLKDVYVLASAFEDGDEIVPVKLEVKEFTDKQNTLYISIALDSIKKDEFVRQEVAKGVAQQYRPSSNISIADLLRNVNPLDESFYKYIPKMFFEGEKSTKKQFAISSKESDLDLLFDESFYERYKNESKEKITESLAELEKIKAREDFQNRPFDEIFDINAKISALKAGYTTLYDYYVGKEKQRLTSDYEYSLKTGNPTYASSLVEKKKAERAKAERLQADIAESTPHKNAQFEIIQQTNPMFNDTSVGIRSPKDIHTFAEVLDDGDSFNWGDFSKEDARKALKDGKIRVYSSYPIKNGVFVSTSYQQALDYAGGEPSGVHSRVVALDSVAWINGDEGQYAKVYGSTTVKRYALKGSDKVMTELPDEKVTIKDVLQGRATKAELATQVKGGMAETSEAVKVLMTNAQAALERVLTENGIADATARTNYIRAGKYAAHNAIETQGGQYSLDGETRVGDSLGKIMQPIYKANEKDGKTYADFELYLLHYHNIDRMAVGKPVFGDDVTAADSQTAIAELDKEYPQFRKIAEKIWKFNDNNLQLSVDSGMYSQEYADTLREMYPHYVPTFREEYATRAAALMGKNNVWVNNAKKAAKGSSARILPIDDMMAAQTIQKTTSARINSLLVEMLEKGDHDEFKVIATEDAEIQIDDDTQVTTYEDKTKNTHQVTFYHNGKKVTAQVSRLVFKGIEAFRASSDMSDNVALNAVAKVNSTFKKLVTSLNPFFSFFKNPIRDMQDALLYTRYSHREYLKNYNRARQEIAHNGHYWQEAKAAGITAASVYDYQKGIEYKQNDAGAKAKRFWGKLESASNAIEMAPRMAEYISAREAGLSVQEALLQAQDVTTNFGRGGTFAKKLNSTVMPFLNPAIQGFSKMWRSYTGENGKKAWVSLIIRSLILGIGATALNDLLNGDDEEYENLSDYVKEQNYVIALGGGDFLKIPKGRVIGVFGNAFLRGKRYAQGETDAWEGYFDSVMSSVTPVDNFTRTIFSPITDVQTNTTWYGGAIESQKWNDTEPKNRYDESTSKISIWLGSVFNYSPIKIDYLLEQYTGIIGDLVLPATSTQAESGVITQNMLVNSTTNSKWSTKFYNALEDYTYKKTAGDLQAKGAVRYLNSINSTISDMYNQKRTIQADKTLSNDEKLTQTKIIQAAINTLMQEAIGNAEYIYGEMGKYDLSDDDVFDQAYLDSISLVMGEEYALKTYNKDVYEKAVKINKLGIDYATYYDFYFGIKNITSDKKADGSTVAGSKKAKVINYVMAQNLSTAQKLVLIMAQGYSIADGDVKGLTAKQAKMTVAKYITSLNLTREEKTELAEMLGFTVKNGKIYFN